MRTEIIHSTFLKGRAYAGTYVVTLAWDFENFDPLNIVGLLGFTIERTEFKNAEVIEKYWMKGIKRFKNKDKSFAPGTPVSTTEHPFQSFQWADYTALQNRDYSYRIVPVYGSPKLLDVRHHLGLEIAISTETEMIDAQNAENHQVKHDLYFNRGVIGSQAYAREFGNKEPDRTQPFSKEMKWLSRGLFEALLKFISLAKDENYALHAALYEFHYLPVANAFMSRIEAGVDVKIVYDAESTYKKTNEETIRAAQLDLHKAVIPRTVTEGIRHNKFIVLLKNEQPIAVWTGSTNISAGGIFGHSNVGHIVWDEQIATAYHNYWKNLADNISPAKLRAINTLNSPIPAGKPEPNTITPVFSARDGKEEITTLQWYADLMATAQQVMCITFAFNIDPLFQKVIQQDNDVLRYLVKDDELGSGETIGQDRDVIFAAGSTFGANELINFREESGNPLNSNDYIHNKFMLVDPLSEDPIVVTGSANFSKPSQRSNDENMLVIRGDTRVADIYFGEFMRIFDHHYARYISRKMKDSDHNDPDAGYLKPDNSWVAAHFNPVSYKSKRRKYFIGL